jgi:hypothetical protein
LRIEGKKEEKVHLAGKCIFKGIKKKKSLLTGEGRLALFDSANPTFTSNYPPPSLSYCACIHDTLHPARLTGRRKKETR